MSYSAGTAWLQISPSFRGVVQMISAEAAKWGDSAGSAFADTFKARVDAALANLPDAKIAADTSEADQKLAGIRAELESLSSQNVGVDITDEDAKAKIDELIVRLDELGAKSPSIRVDVDAARAEVELAAVALESDALSGGLKDVGGAAGGASGGLGGMASSAGDAAGAIAPLTAGMIALGAALVPIGGLALGALATLPSIIAGATTGLGALYLGLSGPLTAISDFRKTQAPAAIGSSNSATQAISDAAAERNATDSVTNATRGLANARSSAAQTIGSDEKSITDAVKSRNQAVIAADQQLSQSARSLASARQQAADSIHSAEETFASTERQVTEAVYTETQAQNALVAARQSAADQLRSYQDQLADGALQQQAAALAVTQAQQNLQSVQSNPASTDLQIAQSKLALQQAQQAVQDQSDSYAILQRNAAAAAAAGVDGSAQVVTAQHAAALATQGVADAQQSQADAAVALSEAQATGAQNVLDAENALATAWAADTTARAGGNEAIRAAEKKLAEDRVKNAENIGVAERAVSVALQNQADTIKRIAIPTGTAATATNTYTAALNALTPSGRKFVEFFVGPDGPLKVFGDLKAAAQDALLPGLQTALVDMLPFFKDLGGFITDAATGIGQTFDELGKFLGSKQGLIDMNALFAAGNAFMSQMGGLIVLVLKAIGTIGTEAVPITKELGKGIVAIVDAFAKWVSNGGFEKFVNWLKENGPQIVQDLKDFAGAAGKIVIAATPLGKLLLDIVGDISSFITSANNTDPDILKYGVDIAAIALALKAVSAGIGLLAGKEGFATLETGLLGSLPAIGRVSLALGGLSTILTGVLAGLAAMAVANVVTAPTSGAIDAGTIQLGEYNVDQLKQKPPASIKTIQEMIDWLKAHGVNMGGDGTAADWTAVAQYALTHRANGGSVDMGSPYLVGEKGMEMFVPSTSGTIVPADLIASLFNKGGSPSSGPAVNIEHATFADTTDLDALIQRMSFARIAMGL